MHATEFTRLLEAVASLSARQIEVLQDALSRLGLRMEALREIEGRVPTPAACTECGSHGFTRWGRTRTGLQRWRCRGCGATRSTTTGTAVAGVRRPHLFHALIREMFSERRSTCRGAARRLGVDKMTIWRWRQIILSVLEGIGSPELGGIVEADETFQRESRKGSREWVRHAADPAAHPAPPRPRWSDYGRRGIARQRGLSRWQVPILTALDRSGRRRAQVISDLRDRTTVAALAPFLQADAILCSDGASRYERLAAAKGMTLKVTSSKRGGRIVEGVFHIQNVNALHSRYKEFIKTFRGPATKHLPKYVAWFLASLAPARDGAPDVVWDRMLS